MAYLDTSKQVTDLINTRGTERSSEFADLNKRYDTSNRLNSIIKARKLALDAENAINNLSKNIGYRTSGKNMTNAQRAAILANEQTGLTSNLNALNKDEQSGMAGMDLINTAISNEMSIPEKKYNDLLNALSGQASNELTLEESQKAREAAARENELQRAFSASQNALNRSAQAINTSALERLMNSWYGDRSTNVLAPVRSANTAMNNAINKYSRRPSVTQTTTQTNPFANLFSGIGNTLRGIFGGNAGGGGW